LTTALLLSGGMDSVAIAWWKRPDMAITIDYGQKAARAEETASAAVCSALNIRHVIVRVDCSSLGSGDMALTQADAAAPTSDWWPFRNQMLVTLAGMKAISLGVTTLMIGSVASDSSHVDGTPEFVARMASLMAFQEGGLRVQAPAIAMTTAQLIRTSGVPPSLMAWAHSCHKGNVPCYSCRGCNKYLETYEEVGFDLDRPG
jgi:7-cyano-7-deazaguanine synthase